MTNNLTEDQKTNLDTLIAHLEQLPDAQFDMDRWTVDYRNCGTVACIGGWCETLFSDQEGYWDISRVSENCAGYSIGLDPETSERLFYGDDLPKIPDGEKTGRYELSSIDKPMAIAALKDLRRTGKFENWGAYGAKPVMSYGDD